MSPALEDAEDAVVLSGLDRQADLDEAPADDEQAVGGVVAAVIQYNTIQYSNIIYLYYIKL